MCSELDTKKGFLNLFTVADKLIDVMILWKLKIIWFNYHELKISIYPC